MLNPVNINTPLQTIIQPERYNGRINIVNQPDTSAVFRMQERIALKNKSTEYRSALAGNVGRKCIIECIFFCG